MSSKAIGVLYIQNLRSKLWQNQSRAVMRILAVVGKFSWGLDELFNFTLLFFFFHF